MTEGSTDLKSITTKLAGRAKNVFPDARLTAADTRPFPLTMERGEGDKIYDVEGNEYLDFHLSSGALVLGHGHPEVLQAVQQQVSLGFNFGAMNRAAIDLGEQIIDAVPSIESLKFTVSGTEATLHAIRLARTATGRDLILRFEGAYHGHLDMVSLSSKMKGLTVADADDIPDVRAIADCDGIPDAIVGTCLVAPFNNSARLEQIFAVYGNRIAGVIMEPLQRFIEPAPGFLQAVRDITKRYGSLLVFDEIVTGFRLARGGAQELYGVEPDLTCMGKIIGAGFPNGAIGGSLALMQDLFGANATKSSYLAGTFAGHPVVSAGGAATLATLAKAGSYQRLNDLGDRLRKGVTRAFASTGVAGRIYCPGAMFHLSMTSHEITDGRSGLHENGRARTLLWNALLRRKIHITGGRGFVSLQHSEATIDAFVERFEDALNEIKGEIDD